VDVIGFVKFEVTDVPWVTHFNPTLCISLEAIGRNMIIILSYIIYVCAYLCTGNFTCPKFKTHECYEILKLRYSILHSY